MSNTAQDPIETLRQAGVKVDNASAEQREILTSLSPAEVSVLSSVARNLEDDVQAHEEDTIDNGVILW